ncbi:hypothetical protein HDU96_000809 [Phlyctochytrium bullatum]|nr:hypothetical protein HDU96_000809 [Phlyctochytrium bullatum]
MLNLIARNRRCLWRAETVRHFSSSVDTLAPLSPIQKFATPLLSFLLYSTLTLVTLQYIRTRLEFEEEKIAGQSLLKDFQKELEHAKQIAASGEGSAAPTSPGTSKARSWYWPF